jgi:predicted porin
MKKKLLAVAVVGALASPVAFAQTLYGIVDLGYQNAKHADGDVNKHFLVQGQHSGSRLGVRGSEDLAGGLYAMYQIEFNIVADNGSPAGTGTQRLTFVGLGSKAWGEFTIGQQYTHHFHTIAPGSATAYATFTSIAGQVPELTRASNSIKYSSPVMGGFAVGFLYGLSGTTTGAANGLDEATLPGQDRDYWDAAIRYTPGPFGVAAATGKASAEAAGIEAEVTMHQLSANWDNRAFGIYGNWFTTEAEVTGVPGSLDASGFGLSGIARFGGRHEVSALWYRNEVDVAGDPKATTYALVYQHIMSKRTRIYTGIAKTKNDDGMNIAPTAFVTGVAPGYDPRGFQLGIVHTF